MLAIVAHELEADGSGDVVAAGEEVAAAAAAAASEPPSRQQQQQQQRGGSCRPLGMEMAEVLLPHIELVGGSALSPPPP
eukprot:COSAG01_NODE_9065_length_2565_cov_1.956204_3_plen_79_part_00